MKLTYIKPSVTRILFILVVRLVEQRVRTE